MRHLTMTVPMIVSNKYYACFVINRAIALLLGSLLSRVLWDFWYLMITITVWTYFCNNMDLLAILSIGLYLCLMRHLTWELHDTWDSLYLCGVLFLMSLLQYKILCYSILKSVLLCNCWPHFPNHCLWIEIGSY